jgi:hypothetical protein
MPAQSRERNNNDKHQRASEAAAHKVSECGALALSPYEFIQLEFTRRQIAAQIQAGEYTMRNARYMLWSVIVLTISSILSVAVTIAK